MSPRTGRSCAMQHWSLWGLPAVIRCVAGEGPVRVFALLPPAVWRIGTFPAIRPCCRPSPPPQHVPDCRDVPLAASGGGDGSGVEGGGEGGEGGYAGGLEGADEGRTSAAKWSARVIWAARPMAAASGALFGLPKGVPRAFRMASAARVRSAMRRRSFRPARRRGAA